MKIKEINQYDDSHWPINVTKIRNRGRTFHSLTTNFIVQNDVHLTSLNFTGNVTIVNYLSFLTLGFLMSDHFKGSVQINQR